MTGPRLAVHRVGQIDKQQQRIFIDAIPKTGVGKFDKKVLRKQYELLGNQD